MDYTERETTRLKIMGPLVTMGASLAVVCWTLIARGLALSTDWRFGTGSCLAVAMLGGTLGAAFVRLIQR